MTKRSRMICIVLATLLGLAVLAVWLARFDPNDYKPWLIELVQQKTQRTLTIPGHIRLTVFPSPGADLGRLTLSEPGSAAPFIAIQSAKISLQLLPLLRREMVVDKIDIDGLQATLRKTPEGRDAEAALPPRGEETGPVRFEIDRVSLRNASVRFDDPVNRRQIMLSELNVVTGRLAQGAMRTLSLSAKIGVDRPAVAARLRIKTTYALDRLQPRLSLSDSEIELKGLLAAREMRALVTATRAVELTDQHLQAPQLRIKASLPNPAGGVMTVTASGNVLVNIGEKNSRAQFSGQFDASRFDLRLALTGTNPSLLHLDMVIDALDLARYRAAPAAGNPVGKASSQRAAEAEALDLSALSALHADGSLAIERVQNGALTMRKLKAVLNARDGQLRLSPLSAHLYGGTLNGSVSATASKAPRLKVKQTLSGIALAPLLHDLLGKAPIEGRGELVLDLTTEGGNAAALKKKLNGQMSITVGDGAIRGINIARVLREAKNKFNAVQGAQRAQSAQVTGSAGREKTDEKTDFSALTATVWLTDGVARNDDLDVKSPLLRVKGKGQADLVAEKLDYLITATVVSSLQGQGGPELSALKGLAVPVRFAGPFHAVDWKLDVNTLTSQVLRQQLEQKKDTVRSQVKDKLNEQLKGLFER